MNIKIQTALLRLSADDQRNIMFFVKWSLSINLALDYFNIQIFSKNLVSIVLILFDTITIW